MIDVIHICVAMKPIEGNFAENAIEHGVCGLNIDGARVGTQDNLNGGAYAVNSKAQGVRRWEGGALDSTGDKYIQPEGRWPANVILDGSDEVTGQFPYTKTGDTKAIPYTNTKGKNVFGKQTGVKKEMKGDEGCASRYFKEIKDD